MSASNVVDSKVVELQFNNQNFESNAKTSLSTLERLKAALNFSKDTKGFDEVTKSAKNFDVRNITSGVESLRFSLSNIAKISAFRIISDQASQAFDAVKRLGGELSELNGYKGIMAGFDKYSSKTEAVQTIMAATAKDFSDTGEQMAVVNEQLDKLNWFTDETSYSFLDMVSNIGKFTSNNIALDKSVTAMEGISTWAAVSGAKVDEAGRAMYNLSQAIATGAVKLMDWKSIENANMATAEFKQTAIDTAVEIGTLTKAGEGLYKTTKGTEVSIQSFNQTLSEGWFTSDVLMDTLNKYGEFTDKLHGVMEQVDVDTTSKMLEYVDQFKKGTIDIDAAATDAGVSVEKMKSLLTELSDPAMEFGMKAFKAAQEAKTFEEAIDATKDAVSTGWMNTWEIIFGDYEHAKGLWTNVANDLWDIFASGGEARNDFLREAFQAEQAVTQEQWDSVKEAGLVSPDFVKAVRASAAEHGHAVEEMISDEEFLSMALKNSWLSVEDLDAGYNKVFGGSGSATQVDEALKSQVESLKESSDEFKSLFDILDKNKDADASKIIFGDGSYAEGYEELEGAMDKMLSQMGLSQTEGEALKGVLQSMGYFGGETASAFDDMSDAQLKEIGWTEKQIEAFRKAKESGENLHQVLDDIANENMTGQELFAGGIHNALSAVANVIATVRDSFNETFNGVTAGGLKDILRGFYEGTAKIADFAENSETLKNVFRALGSAANFAFNIISGGLSVIKKGFTLIAGPIGKVTNMFSGAVKAAVDWANKINLVGKATTFINSKLEKAASAVGGWINGFVKLPAVQKYISRFKASFGYAFGNAEKSMDTASASFDTFLDNIKKLSSVKNLKITDVISQFKTDVIDKLGELPVFKLIGSNFKGLKDDAKEAFASIGIDLDAALGTFKMFGDITGSVLGTAADSIGSLVTKVPGLFKQFTEIPFVSRAITGLGNGFKTLQAKSLPFLTEAKTRFEFLLNWAKRLDGGLTLDNAGKVLEKFGKTISALWNSNNNPFKDIIESAKNLGGDIAKKFVNFKGFDGLTKALGNVGETVTDFFTGKKGLGDIIDSLGGVKDKIVETFTGTDFAGAIGDAFSSLGDTITGFLSDHGIDVEGIAAAFTKIKDSITGMFEDIKIPQPLVDFFNFITGTVTAKASEIDGAAVATEESGNKLTDGINGVIEGLKEAGEAAGPIGEIIDKIGKPITGIIGLLLGIISVKSLIKAAKSIVKSVGGVLDGLTSVLKAQEKDLNASAKLKNREAAAIGVAAFVGAILGIVLALKILDTVNPDNMIRNLGIVAGIIAALVVVAAVMEKVGGKSTLAGGAGVFLMVLSIVGIMVVLKLLEVYKINWDKIGNIAANLVVILLALAAVMFVTRAIGPNAKGAEKSILAMVIAVAAMAALMWALSQMDPGALKQGLVAIGLISLMLAGLMFVSQFAKGAAGSLVALALCIAVLGGVMYGLSGIDPDVLMNVAESLGLVMAILAGLMVVTKFAAPSIGGVLALIVIFGLVSGVMALIATFVDVEKFAKVGNALAEVFTALGIAMLAISVAGFIAQFAMAGIGVLLLTFVLLTAAIVGIGYLCEEFDGLEDMIAKGAEVLIFISHAIGEAFGAFLGGIGEGIMASVPGMAESLVETFDKLQVLNDMQPLDDAKINQAIGTVLKISLAGFADSLLSIGTEIQSGRSAAEQFAADLDALSVSLPAFCESMNAMGSITFDEEGIANLRTMIGKISLTGFVDSLYSIGTEIQEGNSAVEQFASDLTALSASLVQWQADMTSIGSITVPVDSVNQLAIAVSEVTMTGFGSGLDSIVTELQSGQTAMERFQSDASTLATTLADWQTDMEAIGEITVPKEEIDKLVESIKEIPNGGGLFTAIGAFFTGSSDVEGFKEKASTLAEGLTEWQTKMETIGDIKVPKEEIDKLVAALEEIPNGGGLFDAVKNVFTGAPDFEGFKENLGKLGDGIKGFTDALGEDLDTSTLTTAAEAVKLLGTMGTDLKGQDFGGWFHEGDMTNFGKELVTLGEKLAEFASYEVDTDKLESMAKSAQTLGTFGKMVDDISVDEENLSGLSDAVNELNTATENANGIDISSGDIADTSKVTKFKQNIETLVEAINEAGKAKTGGVQGFIDGIDALNEASVTAVSAAKNAVSDDDTDMSGAGSAMADSWASGIADSGVAVSDAARNVASDATAAATEASSGFNDVGASYMSAMMLGIMGASSLVSTAIGTVASSAAQAATGYASSMESVGADFAYGFANGIRNHQNAAVNAAIAMAVAAINAARRAQDSHSPSKETYKLGTFFTQGYGNAIRDNTRSVVRVATDMVERSLSCFKGATDAIKDIFTSDIDADPVIRPVLDLSGIKSGSKTINDMFNSAMPVGVSANVRAINGAMSDRNSASSMDILDALNRLNDGLSGVKGGDTYNVNGITYDDGSNISMAVRDLIRTVRVGRRM